MAPKQLSSDKRKAEEQGGRPQARRLSLGAQTKPGVATRGSSLKPPNKELVRLMGDSGKAAQAVAAEGRGARLQGSGLQGPQTRRRDAPPAPASAAKQQQQQQQARGAAKAPAAAAPGKGKAAGQGGKAKGKAAAQGRRLHLAEAALDGETFRVGDNVYVVLDESVVADLDATEEEECACIVCGGPEKEEEGPQVMLECDRCLSGCHLGCCSPPLAEVPEGEWVCPDCAGGRSPRARRAATARERFLQRQGLGLARIDAIWQEPNGDYECTYRWYCVPEETHTGRQRHHLAREVFLMQQRDACSLASVLRHAHVLTPAQFQAGEASRLGEDVFVCEYLYDSAWQRFRRRTEFDGDSEDEGEEWGPQGDGSESEEEDAWQPAQEAMAERGLLPGGGTRRGGGGAINRRKQGGDEYLAQVGALAVPVHARAARAARHAGPRGALAQARSALTLAAVPKSLPCREAEREAITEFVTEVLGEDSGKCLYVSGIPGTGKTATVLEVMRGLKRRSEAGEVPAFQFVEINGLRLPSPQHAYSALYEALTGDRAGPQAAAAALEELFSSGGGGGGRGGRRPTIVLVDEMDLLVNKTQTVLYNLFDWPGRKGSRLSIIGIANTMDLPERLHPRIGSRLAGRRIVFQPYTREQLATVIRSRLESVPAFHPRAIDYISLRIANNSGDMRRCLELARRSVEIAEEAFCKQQRQQDEQQQQQQASGSDSGSCEAASGGGSSGPAAGQQQQQQQETGQVEMRHVGAAIAEMFNTGHVRLMAEASRLERLLLAAIYLETASSGRAECVLADAWERLRLLCSQNCEPQAYDFGGVLERAVDLGARRLIICDPGVRRVRVKVALNVPANDLLMVLGDDPDLPWLQGVLSRATYAPPVGAQLAE